MIHVEHHPVPSDQRSDDAPSVHVHHEGLYDLGGYDACRNER